MFVPVIDKDRRPLMPTTPSRARRWIKVGKATPFWSNGVFCVRLNVKPSDTKKQDIVVGIDPGSKREAFTVKSDTHTYLNVLADAVTWVKDAVKERRGLRRTRRKRKTPCRQDRMNRIRSGIPPSTRARWQLKLRVVNRLRRVFPITDFVVEDIKAVTRGKKEWDVLFSPLEVGKRWFYNTLRKLGNLKIKRGYETKELRDTLGLKKIGNKMSESFNAHNVDSWVLANWWIGGHTTPDNTKIKRMIPLHFHRRQLHRIQPDKKGNRKRYGGTMSLGLKKGSLIKHLEHGLCYVGGNLRGRLSIHSFNTGKRIRQDAAIEDVKFLSYNAFR
jgi:hypothetical protein